MANSSLPVNVLFFAMLLLKVSFSTSIQVSPSMGGETPPIVVITELRVKSPPQLPLYVVDLHSNTWNFLSNLGLDKPRPKLLLPVNFCSQVTHVTSRLCAYGSSVLTLVDYSPIPHIPWYLNPSCHWEPSTASKIKLLITNFPHTMNMCNFIPFNILLVPHLGISAAIIMPKCVKQKLFCHPCPLAPATHQKSLYELLLCPLKPLWGICSRVLLRGTGRLLLLYGGLSVCNSILLLANNSRGKFWPRILISLSYRSRGVPDTFAFSSRWIYLPLGGLFIHSGFPPSSGHAL